MSHTVEKIGGTSMSEPGAVVENIMLGNREEDSIYRRIFVVSAYSGITNLLLEHKKTGAPGVYALFADSHAEWAWGNALSEVAEEMQRINGEIFGEHPDHRIANQFVRERIEGVRSCLLDLQRICSYGHFNLSEHLDTVLEMLSSLGEAHSAHNTALLLQQHGINARFVDLTGWRDEEQPSLDDRIRDGLREINIDHELPILTGYAHCKEGIVGQYGRGYTEVTLSRVAVLTGADEAIIHKEFHLSSADPKIVGAERVRTIGRTNYDVADQLSNMGMEAIHPGAAKALRQAEIPLRVKNTFDPKDPGTIICSDYVSVRPRVEIVTGIKGLYALEFFEQDMVGVKGYDAAILDALQRHRVRIVTKTSNANTIVHYLAGSLESIKRVITDLRDQFDSAKITIRKVAIVTAIGSDLKLSGLTATAVSALTRAEIDVIGIHQLIRNVDVLFIVEEADFERAIVVLHEKLIEENIAERMEAEAPAFAEAVV